MHRTIRSLSTSIYSAVLLGLVSIPPGPTRADAPANAVELGSSGTAVSGNITPSFNGKSLLRAGIFAELARDISDDPVDPASEATISQLLGGATLHVDWAASTAHGGNSSYGIPINIVPGTQPAVPVVLGAYARESDAFAAPIPSRPSVESWIDQSHLIDAATRNDGHDHHMLIGLRNEATGNIDRLYELYRAYFDGRSWHAATLAVFDLASGTPRPLSWTSADAAGLPILPLLVRYDEAAAGAIKHSLRFTLDPGQIRNRYVWPARHAAVSGRPDIGIPFGARLRLRRSWYEAHKLDFTREARAIVDALFTFGMINADIGGKLFVQGVTDDRWDQSNLLSLNTIPSSAFEMTKVTPLWSITGPDCLHVGETGTFHANHFPASDSNVNKSLYLMLDGSHASNYGKNGMSAERIEWNDRTGNSIAFTYTPKTPGTHIIQGDPAGEYFLPPEPTVVTTCP